MKTQKQQKEVHAYRLETSVCYNPFFLTKDGLREGEVSAIKFFKVENGVGKVIASCKWFTIKRDTSDKKERISSNNSFHTLELPYSNIPYRRKESFDKDLAFYMKTPDKYTNSSLLVLYLNISELPDFKIENSDPELLYSGSEVRTHDIVTFGVKCTSRRTDWDGAENCVRTACFTCNHHHIKTDFGLMCEEIADIFGHNMHAYDVAALIEKGVMDKVIEIYNNYYKNASKELSQKV